MQLSIFKSDDKEFKECVEVFRAANLPITEEYTQFYLDGKVNIEAFYNFDGNIFFIDKSSCSIYYCLKDLNKCIKCELKQCMSDINYCILHINQQLYLIKIIQDQVKVFNLPTCNLINYQVFEIITNAKIPTHISNQYLALFDKENITYIYDIKTEGICCSFRSSNPSSVKQYTFKQNSVFTQLNSVIAIIPRGSNYYLLKAATNPSEIELYKLQEVSKGIYKVLYESTKLDIPDEILTIHDQRFHLLKFNDIYYVFNKKENNYQRLPEIFQPRLLNK